MEGPRQNTDAIPMPDYLQSALRNLLDSLLKHDTETVLSHEGFSYVVEITGGTILPTEVHEIIERLPNSDVTYTYIEETGEIIIRPVVKNIN